MRVATFPVLLVLVKLQLVISFTVILSDPGSLVDPQLGSKTDPIEQEAVYDIMRATGNDWATDIPNVCRGRWHGIECVPDKDNVFHVVSLSFGSLSDDTAFPTCDPTRSTISPSITKLPHLRTLFFYRCFTNNPQPIPPFIGLLPYSLQTLVLRENGHVGPIPPDLGNLTRLTVLDLHGNNLNGSIPVALGRISGLRSLDLSRNRLSGSIPNISLPSLNILDLNQNHLKGSLPPSLLTSPSLLKIDISRNRISGQIPNLNSLNLILLDLSYNTLTGPIPNSLNNLKSLQALVLSGNPSMSAAIPDNAFIGLDNLTILGLSDTNSGGPIPESIGRLRMLRVLHLDRNQLNGTIPASFGGLDGLTELRLDNNMLSGPIPFKRERVWKMGRKLRLDNNLGLCFNGGSGLGDDLDTAGIGRCHEAKTLPSIRHNSVQSSRKSTIKSGASHPTTITALFLFVSSLLLHDTGLYTDFSKL